MCFTVKMFTFNLYSAVFACSELDSVALDDVESQQMVTVGYLEES